MQVTELANEGLKREFRVVVPARDIADQVDVKLSTMSRDVRMPGFRPGKVPVALLKKQYGQAVMGEVLEQTVNTTTQQAISDRGLRVALQPRVEVTKFAEGEDLEFSFAVEVLPEIGQIDFASIKLDRLKVDVSEAEVEEALTRIAAQSFIKTPVDRPAATGDIVTIDFVGTIDGKAFEGGTAKGVELELGSNNFIPGFEDQLIGVKPGDKKDLSVTFPADYAGKEVAGKQASFACEVLQVQAKSMRPVDDEFAKKAGFETMAAMRQAIRERIEREYSSVSRARMKRQLLDRLADTAKFAVPDGLVEIEFNSIWQRVEEAKKAGEKLEDDEEKMRVDYRDIALRRVRLGLMLAEVGRSNNIMVTPDELNRAVLNEAQRYPGQERQVLEFYGKNPQLKDQLRAPIFEDKAVDFIFELAEVSDKPVTREELLRDPDEPPASESK